MKIELPYKFGQVLFLKHDVEQRENILRRIIIEPKGNVILDILTHENEFLEVPESFITEERDIVKATSYGKED